MNRLQHFALVAGVGLFQGLTILNSSAQPTNSRSLEELYQIRDRLVATLEKPSSASEPSFFSSPLFQDSTASSAQVREQLQAVEVKILAEQKATDNWQQALRLATQALEISNTSDQSVATRQKIQFLWQQALSNLREIPNTSVLAKEASSKLEEYQRNLTTAMEDVRRAETDALAQIAQESGLSRSAMVTVCRLSRDCIHLRGDQPPRSPASLIKVPVAVALLHKVAQEKISLEQPIYVQPGNFTEDASDIRSRQKYSLKKLLGEMIDHSSNIATNELIDYLGRDYINNYLEDQGYQVTRVNFKLMGDRILPFNPGRGANRLTSDELTEMMVQVYNQEIPGNRVLMDALGRQYDRNLGFAALQGTQAKWLGEKTGENSRALGTTLAMSLDGDGYVITVIDNNAGRDPQIRNCINKIVERLARQGHL